MINKKVKLPIQHLISIEPLDKEIIEAIFERTRFFLELCLNKRTTLKNLTGKVVANLFFESSTRTRNSFTLAAERLGAIVLNPNMTQLSTTKGESLLDTIHTLEAMGTDLFIIRHSDSHSANFIATELKSDAVVINAGDGNNEHPTQCLADLFTINHYKRRFKDIKVAIIGDILHSRVARSLIEGLHIMGTTSINLIAPPTLLPATTTDQYKATTYNTLEEGLANVDVIVALRIQKERIPSSAMPDFDKFYREFGLTPATLAFAKPNAIVMHPGPLNRGIEIDSCVADGPQSVILKQVHHGLAVRMALMDMLLNK